MKRRTGPAPWKELAGMGTLPLAAAVQTGGGRLPVHLIHVVHPQAKVDVQARPPSRGSQGPDLAL